MNLNWLYLTDFFLIDNISNKNPVHGIPQSFRGRKLREEKTMSIQKQLRVLLIEDNPVIQAAAGKMLKETGIEISFLNNGKALMNQLAKISTDASSGMYDVIFMDIEMPEMDGLETTKHLRSDSRFAHIPIIALTAHDEDGKREICYKCGMNDFLNKPFSKDDLITVLEKWTGKSLTTMPDEASLSSSFDADGNAIDFSAAMKRFGGDKELFTLVLRRFVKQYANAGKKIEDTVSKSNIQIAVTTLHTMKGSAGMISAHRLQTASKKLEQCLLEQSRDCPKKLTEFLKALELVIQDAKAILASI
jgi:two-component system sensor histidine kinase/response regulator